MTYTRRDTALGRLPGQACALAIVLSTASATLAGPLANAQARAGSEGPLLSGYGGPGAGQQAILGAQMLRGGGRHQAGGGEARGSGEGGQSSGQGVSLSTPSTVPAASSGGTAPTGSHVSGGEGSATNAPATQGHGTGITGSSSAPSGASETAVVAAQPLGLSGSDLAAVIVTACALVAVAFLTRRAAKGEQ